MLHLGRGITFIFFHNCALILKNVRYLNVECNQVTDLHSKKDNLTWVFPHLKCSANFLVPIFGFFLAIFITSYFFSSGSSLRFVT